MYHIHVCTCTKCIYMYMYMYIAYGHVHMSGSRARGLEGARVRVVTQAGQALEPYVTRTLQRKHNNFLYTMYMYVPVQNAYTCTLHVDMYMIVHMSGK